MVSFIIKCYTGIPFLQFWEKRLKCFKMEMPKKSRYLQPRKICAGNLHSDNTIVLYSGIKILKLNKVWFWCLCFAVKLVALFSPAMMDTCILRLSSCFVGFLHHRLTFFLSHEFNMDFMNSHYCWSAIIPVIQCTWVASFYIKLLSQSNVCPESISHMS
jgi:hypothetical protein